VTNRSALGRLPLLLALLAAAACHAEPTGVSVSCVAIVAAAGDTTYIVNGSRPPRACTP
jgi:hypothetical protein